MDTKELRLRLLENGWSPIRNRDKTTYLKGWPTLEITPEVVDEWARRNKRDTATGIRIENGLVALDIDIDDAGVVDELANAVMDIVPELEEDETPWLERSSGRAKVAWFFRVDEPFGRLHSRRWLKPGETAEEHDTQFVEAFGGASSRQFGAFGPHTLTSAGEVVREYAWRDRSPVDTRVSELPVLTKAQVAAVVDAAERLMEAAGWSPVALSTAGENASERVYDLTDDMEFVCSDGVTRSLAELRETVSADGDGMRCSASFLEGPSAKRTDRCLVSLTQAGHVHIWESATGVSHLEASSAPVDHSTVVDVDRLAELLQEAQDRRRNRLNAGDDFASALTKALGSYAWYSRAGMVFPMWPRSVAEGERLSSFRVRLMKHGYRDEAGPRGGRGAFHNPVDAWQQDERLVVVEGVQMRPDMPRPTFTENGETFINCYRPEVFRPDEAEGGSAAAGFDFLSRLVPDEAERRTVLQWMAFKLRNPHVPMWALVMVAHQQFGTGRNTLGDLMALLLGRTYVREVPFETFTGKTYQSQYNDWQADALLVVVSESSEDTDGSIWKTKRNTYERLKLIVDPRPGRVVQINMKGLPNYYTQTSASFLIATNHADALPIPENDRRFCVVRNGDTQPPAYWEGLRRWMGSRANLAAFAHALGALSLEGFDPFSPPLYEGKSRMAEESKSDIDQAFEIALRSLPGRVVTFEQVDTAVRKVFDGYDLERPHGQISTITRKLVQRNMHRVGERHGPGWYIREGEKRFGLYARTAQDAAVMAKQTPSWRAADARRNGALNGTGVVLVEEHNENQEALSEGAGGVSSGVVPLKLPPQY